MSFDISYTYGPAGNRSGKNDGTTLTEYAYSPANRVLSETACAAPV
jgi:hypothetical protein